MPQSDQSVQPNLSSERLENSGQSVPDRPKSPASRVEVGKVYLVGAGPGDPRLITLRGVECLELADVVLYDGLANPRLLDFASQAEKISVGKHGIQPIWSQPDINHAMVSLAKAGKIVVRLKGGDPAVFARTAEELEALEAGQIPFEVVPGITAALAVAGYTGIPLTHRHHASAVALVTGQQQEGASDDLDWSALAEFPGTLIVYMGVTTSRTWTESLISNGKPGDTPAAIVRRCTWGDQLVIRCTLAEVAGHLTPASKLRPPVLVIVGEVAKLGSAWNWFEQLPLHGVGIWLPRPANQSQDLRNALERQGATVYSDPLIEVRMPQDESTLKNAVHLLRSGAVQGVTFSSVNGVDCFFRFLADSQLDARVLAGVQLATVGPATSKQLEKYGLRSDLQPTEDFSAVGLVDSLRSKVDGQLWLVTTTNHSQDTLASGLERAGARVTTCLTYETVDCNSISDELTQAISSGSVKLAIITSSHIARVAKQFLGDTTGQIMCVALGEKVARVLTELGWTLQVTSESNTTESIYQAVLEASKTAKFNG
jgi:uroporphyrinogen III methyltransferase/synthase